MPSLPRSLLGAVILLAIAAPLHAQTPAADTTLAARLIGTWVIDLRPTPDAPAYEKEFVITSVTGTAFTGTFYDTPIENGRINAAWGDVRLAFVTRDGSGPYHHAATLRAERIEGQSHSLGREFVMVWRGGKNKEGS
jgi:hypothetical protein